MVAAVALPELGFALSLPTEERSLGPSLTGEAAWTRSAARGDREAFGRLVDLHKRAVYGLCLRLLRHPEEARDAAQEAFARAFAGLSIYDPSQPFAPWLLRIARNHCLDLARRRGVEPPHGTSVSVVQYSRLLPLRVIVEDASAQTAPRRIQLFMIGTFATITEVDPG